MQQLMSLPRRSRAGVVAALLLAAAGVSTAAERGALPPDLAAVPRDGAAFVAVRVGEVAEGLAKLAKDDPVLNRMLLSLEARGLPPAGVERVTALLQREPVFAVTGAQPFDKAKLLSALVPDAKVQQVGGKNFLADTGHNAAVYLLNERSVLIGPPAALAVLLDRPAEGEARAALDAALRVAAGKHFLVAGLNPDHLGKDVAPALRPFAPVFAAAGTVVLDLEEKGWVCTLRLPYDSEEAAVAGEKSARAGLEALRRQTPQMIANVRKVPADSPHRAAAENTRVLFEEIQAALKDATVTRTGKVVEGRTRAASENPKRSGGLIVQSIAGAVILLRPAPERPKLTVPAPTPTPAPTPPPTPK